MDGDGGNRLLTVTRRGAMGVMVAAGAGYVLLGPRGGRRHRGDRVVVDYWEKWTGREGQAMMQIVDRFNDVQDRIHVRYLTTGSIHKQAMVAIAGGNPPDVLGLWSYILPFYAESNAVLELDELSTRHGMGPGHYADAIWPLLTHGGRRYAAVNTCGTVALYYDRNAFREVGLDPDRPPRTVSELDEYAQRLTIVDGNGAIKRIGFLHTEPGWWAWCWGHHFGGRLYDPRTNRATAADPANTRAYEWVRSYPRRFGVDRLQRLRSTFGNYASMQQSFLSGKAAMLIQGPWLANIIEAYAPTLDYAAAPVPIADELYDPQRPMAIVESDILVIPRGSRRVAEAMEFIAFTQRQDNVELLSRIHAKSSPLREVSPSFAADHPNRSVAVHDRLLRSPRTFTVPHIRTWPQYRDDITSGFDRIWAMQEPVASVLETIERRAQEQIDLADLRRGQRERRT